MENFILSEIEIERKLKQLREAGKSIDGWETYYHDPQTNERWIYKYYHSDFHGGGIPVLKKDAAINTNEIISFALNTKNLSEVSGAAMELLEREQFENIEFREELISTIESFNIAQLDKFEKERIKLLIYDSELDNPNNEKDILGKHFSQIEKEAKFYIQISERAKSILKKIS